MSKLSARERNLIIVLGVAIVLMLYYTFVLKNFIAEYNDISMQIDNMGAQIDDARMKRASIRMIDEKTQEINEQISADIPRVIDSIDRAEILKMIHEAVIDFTDEIEYVFPMSYVSLKSSYITKAEITFKCPADDCLNVFRALRESKYMNRTITAYINTFDEETGMSDVTIEVEILAKNPLPEEMRIFQ